LGLADTLHGVANDDVVGGDGYGDIEGSSFAEFVMFDCIFDQGLHGDRWNEEIFGRKVGDLDDHADCFGEADLEQIEIVGDKVDLFPKEYEVSFAVTEDISVYEGEGVIIAAGAFGIPGNKEGEGV
jgi:hypothetical protein